MSDTQRAILIATAQTMAVDQMTCEVVEAFRQEHIDSVLLKGPSIAQWLYPHGGRSYGDSDLLVSPGDFPRAVGVLERLGFGHPVRGRAAHAHTYRRQSAPGECVMAVDLHRSLPYITVPPTEAWRVLSTNTGTISLRGLEVAVLAVPQRILHIAMHTLQHAFESSKPFEDLRRALAVVDMADWGAAAEISRALGAEDALAAGLSVLPEGKEVVERLNLSTSRRGILRMASSADPDGPAYEVQRILDAPSFSERLKLMYDGVALSPAVMRSESALARRGRGGLVLAYAYRPVQLVGRLGPALMARRRILKRP
ncbi:MAG TPA: nucleotidyltransferase family protein [Acidimicrobiales bacterium]|jgi:hypothetical protein|nr:nucleotidyltransferase family protein [Acidimicrobiales bacterium]